MKITQVKIGPADFDGALIAFVKDDNNYFAEVIEDGDRYYYRIDGVTIAIEKWEYDRVIENPRLYYFSTALKLHCRIKNTQPLQPQMHRNEESMCDLQETQVDARAPLRCDGQEVGYIEAALGEWFVKYPGPDDMILEDYVERLELKRDGTYSWNPTPTWAPKTGVWGVIKTEEGFLKLCFRDRNGRLRWGFLVVMKIGKDGSHYMNWTRTRGDSVLWADRIWRADRPNR